MKCGCVFVSGQRLVCPTIGPQLVSEPCTVQTCDTQLWSATHSQHGGCVLYHRPNIPLLINCSRYTLHWTWDSINIEILNMWYVQCNVHESQKFFSSENITPDAYQPRPQKTKQFQMSHFHLMIFYYEALVILKSTGHFQFIHLLGFRCLKVFVHVAI